MLISYQAGNKQKIHISADGEYRFTVDASFWYSLGIYQNTDLSEEEFAALEEQIGVRRAFNKGMDLLARRAHSKKELCEKLSKTNEKKYAIIACDLLEERAYLNDADYAAQYFDYLQRVKHFGTKRIAMELGKKGIDTAIITALLQEDESDPRAEIAALLEGKFASKCSDEKGQRRTINTLLRMGYSYRDIRAEMEKF